MHQFWPYCYCYEIFCKISCEICNFFLFFVHYLWFFVFFFTFCKFFLVFFKYTFGLIFWGRFRVSKTTGLRKDKDFSKKYAPMSTPLYLLSSTRYTTRGICKLQVHKHIQIQTILWFDANFYWERIFAFLLVFQSQRHNANKKWVGKLPWIEIFSSTIHEKLCHLSNSFTWSITRNCCR